MLTGLKLSGQRERKKKRIKFVPAVLWLSLSLFEIEIPNPSPEDSKQASRQYNIKKAIWKLHSTFLHLYVLLYFLVAWIPASLVQYGVQNKSRTHAQQLHRILGNICPPTQTYCVPTSFSFYFTPEFSKRYLQEGLCWQRGRSINRASGILKKQSLISASGRIAEKCHTTWNNNKKKMLAVFSNY